jgi:hypothetical protein
MALLKPATLEFLGINFDMVLSFIMAFAGVLLLYARSGRPLPLPTKKKNKPLRTKIEKLHE